MFASVARRGGIFAPTIAALLATWILAVSATALIGKFDFFPGPTQWSADYPQQIILGTVVRAGSPASIIAALAVVPPMSTVMTSWYPARRAI